jgi:hypothetical protein
MGSGGPAPGGPGGPRRAPSRHRGGGGSKGPLIALVVTLCVVLVAGAAAGGWLLLSRDGDGPRSSTNVPGDRRAATRSPSPASEAVKVSLRPITGDQLCAAVPDALRKSLVTDGRYGGKNASTGAATATEKRAACSWDNNKMDVGGGVIGHRSLSISVEARSTDRENALEYAKERFAEEKERNDERVNVRDGKRIDGSTTGSAFGPIRELTYGDASYSQTWIGHSGLKAGVYVRQGPWLIKIEYGGSNRTGGSPAGDDVRAGAGKVAERVAAEMAKDAAKVKLTGPCGILTAKHVESAFFPHAEGPTVGGRDGRIKQTTCGWKVSESVPHKPGEPFTARGGELRIHLVDWGGGGLGSAFQFDRDAKKYDRYHAKGGIGDDDLHIAYEPRQQIAGLGQKAFAVVSTSTRPGREDDRPLREVLVKVLTGDRTIEFVFRGTTTGGGIVGAPGYQEPTFEPAVAQQAVVKLAKAFVADLT